MDPELPTSNTHPSRTPNAASSATTHDQEAIRKIITDVLEFLKQDNVFIKKYLEREFERTKDLIDSANALTVVSAFVAGVQAQINASTSVKNDTKLEIAANVFGFTGLVLDIIGTSTGVIYAQWFRKRVAQWPELLQHWVKTQDDSIHNISEEIAGAQSSVENIRALQAEIFRRRWFWMTVVLPSDDALDAHLALLLHTAPNDAPWSIMSQPGIKMLLLMISPNTDLDKLRVLVEDDPRLAIGAGLSFLLVSVLLFAASSQPLLVWVTSTVTTIVFVSAFLTSMLKDVQSRQMRSRQPLVAVVTAILRFEGNAPLDSTKV